MSSTEIWRRSAAGAWEKLATADIPLQSLVPYGDRLLLGGSDIPIVLSLSIDGRFTTMTTFDDVRGRSEWFANGPPLGVRYLDATQDGNTVIAAVHVGGLPRSQDRGET